MRRGVVDYATVVSCMACHGPKYLKIFESWQGILGRRVSEAQVVLAGARQKLGAADEWFQMASHNIDLVKSGHGVHNTPYALALLESGTRLVNERLEERGYPVRPAPARTYEKEKCYACHQGVELRAGEFSGVRFKHEVHLVTAGLTCAACHRPHEERDEREVVRFGKEGCVGCHHVESKRECSSCHGSASLAKEMTFGKRMFSHPLHLEEAGLTCPDCHLTGKDGSVSLNTGTCTSCHED